MSKLLFYDLETTGLSPEKHGIHQLSGVVDIDGVAVEYFDFKLKPFEGCLIEPDALHTCNLKIETILTYPAHDIAHQQFSEMLAKYINKYDKKDKFHLVGYNNASFDNPFLRTWYNRNNDKFFGSYFWSDTHDTLVLASRYLCAQRSNMLNFKLNTVASFLGIKVNENRLHDAVYDVELTREIYYLLK